MQYISSVKYLANLCQISRRPTVYRCPDYARYLNMVMQRFLVSVNGTLPETYPVPCEKCDQCKWKILCEERRVLDDHLSQVANITRLQVKKLESSGIKTLEALASLQETVIIPKMAPETLFKLRNQARLQHQSRQTGQRYLELLPDVEGTLRGFARLPKPADGDLFFDMEGDPLEEGGLEYLFGLYFFENGKAEFKPFWAHSRTEEKLAFEGFMDFVTGWLRTYPDAHIYHYAAYEQTALKKLMSLHGTREAEVDNLLRAQKLVDLYKVVREGIRVSEPRYSIKNIEHFYLESRTGDVKSAGASIVYYERWKETGDKQLLKDIEDYNYDDVRSTYELRQWLLSLRPASLSWFSAVSNDDKIPEVGELTDEERRLIPYRQQLVDSLPEDRTSWGLSEHLRELTYQLLDFHRRATKPEWWAMFSRMESSEEELLDDGECLAGLTPDLENPPAKDKRSIRYWYAFPEQQSKLKTGDVAAIAHTAEPVRNLVVDEVNRRVSFTRAAGKDPLPKPLALGPGMPVSSKSLVEAVFRFGNSVVSGDRRYPALEDILTHNLPVNLVAMGSSSRNIVLLGDQMQLGQPVQGVHPGRSGESSLEYLLNGLATIPAEQGIFLETTWRMHPDVCRFISDAVYEGRLKAEPNNSTQTLLLNASAHPGLRPTGISYFPAQHDGCSQRSDEEADLVRELIESLLGQRYIDRDGQEHPVTLDDILVVAPYNMQVNLLKNTLPENARVGTVDKFQGQEAAVVIVSMATSSGDYLPRFIEFLYSKNRLNVAISRAKCLAVFIANPALMTIRCSTPEEMALVNTLCWVQEAGA